MGDSGALLLGFVLAAVSVQGLLKTAATVALFFPLLVLAVPIVDTSFVVAKRLKHGQPCYEADRAHLHHRFLNIGFSQPRAAMTMWAWCAILAGAALATRFIPIRRARRLARRGRRSRSPRSALARARDLGLHRLPARDRQARESEDAAPGGSSSRRGRAPQRLDAELVEDDPPGLGQRDRASSVAALEAAELEEPGGDRCADSARRRGARARSSRGSRGRAAAAGWARRVEVDRRGAPSAGAADCGPSS